MPRARAIAISLGLAALLYVTLVAGVDPAHTLAAIVRLDPRWWAALLGLSLCNYALRFARWHAYILWLGHGLGVARHALIYIAGFALTTTPGKAGENLRAPYLARLGVPYAQSIAAFFTERFLDLLAITLLATLVVFAFSGYELWVIAPLLGLGVLLAGLRERRLLAAVHARLAHTKTRRGRLAYRAVSTWDSAFALLTNRPLYAGLGVGLVAWTAEGIGVFVIAHALGVSLAPQTAIGVYALAMLVGALSFVPGGLGTTEATMALLLKLSGTTTATAVAITLIARIATLWFAVLLGLLALAALQTMPTPPRAAPTGYDDNA